MITKFKIYTESFYYDLFSKRLDDEPDLEVYNEDYDGWYVMPHYDILDIDRISKTTFILLYKSILEIYTSTNIKELEDLIKMKNEISEKISNNDMTEYDIKYEKLLKLKDFNL